MKCFSKIIPRPSLKEPKSRTQGREPSRGGAGTRAFSLPEVVAALMIMSLVASSTLLVINRAMDSVADMSLRMQAFEVARENMENLLVMQIAEEMTEYGVSEKYPEIEWQTTIERFEVATSLFGVGTDTGFDPMAGMFESLGLPAMGGLKAPSTSQTWIRAVCTAEYIDTDGEVQTVELTQWLTRLTDQQLQQIARQETMLAQQLFGKDITELDQHERAQLDEMVNEGREAAKLAQEAQKMQDQQDQPVSPADQTRPPLPPGEKGMTEEEFKAFIDEIFRKFQQ